MNRNPGRFQPASRTMKPPSPAPGVSRIDQPSRRTHGFFMRLQRRGKTHSAFFADKKYGGRTRALAAAQALRRKLAAVLGTAAPMSRRAWAELRRRTNPTGIVGVQRTVNRRFKPPRIYWLATWSPEPYVSRRRQFSARKFGETGARQRAIRARRAGLRAMKP